MSSSWDVDSPRITPPGTPPPPYRGGSIGAASCDLNSPAEEHKNGAPEEVRTKYAFQLCYMLTYHKFYFLSNYKNIMLF
jgi:hypothetical protein